MGRDNPNVTRGKGILEKFLSRKRGRKANSLIPDAAREGRILDIGCGTFPYFLGETRFNEKYGIDQTDAVTRYHQLPDSDPSVRLQQWDVVKEGKLPFDNDYFDVVTMLAVFEHIEVAHIRGLVSEIRRTLKGGGMFFLTTPSGWTDRLLRFMARLKLVSAVEIEDHKDIYSHRKVREILQDGGFETGKISLGHFELFMNIWGKAVK
ncbi:MAG: class I SAM-dependent methyltransferase [bacterium]|nr:class I SAM-dependent methyltransferase [bacterium]